MPRLRGEEKKRKFVFRVLGTRPRVEVSRIVEIMPFFVSLLLVHALSAMQDPSGISLLAIFLSLMARRFR